MNLGSIGDLFAVAIGFSVVMLLLSLVVTGVCQGIQSMLSLRGRATRAVLKEFMRQAGKPEAAADAMLKMRRPDVSGGKMRTAASEVMSWLSGPSRRFVSKEQLAQVALPKEDVEQFDAAVTDWFTRWMKYWTIAISVLVAFGFQVSATDLIRDLSIDADLRAKAVEIAAEQKEGAAKAATAARSASFADTNEAVLAQLAREKPALAAALEQMSGTAKDSAEAQAELGAVLDGHPLRAEALAHYTALLGAQSAAPAGDPEAELQKTLDTLAVLKIGFWREGAAFYSGNDGKLQWTNIMGVLLTALFISFGAPFWYEKLKDLNVLRDAIYSRAKPSNDAAGARAAALPALPQEAVPTPERAVTASGAHRVSKAGVSESEPQRRPVEK